MKFAERLRELREERNLSQVQLAKLTGISQAGIAHWENQQRVPNANVVVLLADFFEVTTDYLLGREESTKV